MAKPVNLRTARKQVAREKRRDEAGKTSAMTGLSKPTRRAARAETERASGILDQHRLERPEKS